MSKIHYFQRYSTRENVVTNNTLHLLHRIYIESPKIFESIIYDLCGEKSKSILDVGPTFEQQTGGNGSIPDGNIKQKPFNLLIETKLGDGFDVTQLKNHMDGFSKTENNILIGICRQNLVSKNDKEDLNKTAVSKKCLFEIVTFSQIISSCRTRIPTFRFEMAEMLDDFEEFCDSENLLEPSEDVMCVFPCGDSIELNKQYSIYFCHKDKSPKSEIQYVGFYTNKAVRALGKLTRRVNLDVMYKGSRIIDVLDDSKILFELDPKNQNITLQSSDNSPIPQNVHDDVINFMKESLLQWGWLICNDHTFFILDDLHECNFKKITLGGMLRYRYFYLEELIDDWKKDSAVSDICSKLNQLTWG